jgi:hypothetical protein
MTMMNDFALFQQPGQGHSREFYSGATVNEGVMAKEKK